MDEASPRTMDEVQALTRGYASYSQRRSGLGNVLGGAVGLIAFSLMWLLGPRPVTTALSIGLTIAWLIGKELLRNRLYRRFGQAREVWSPADRRHHVIWVGLLALCLLGFAAFIVAKGDATRPGALSYFVFCLITPPIAWRFLRTIPELMVGFGLLFMDAVVASGHEPVFYIMLWVPLYSLTLISLGLTEHRQFGVLATQLSDRAESV